MPWALPRTRCPAACCCPSASTCRTGPSLMPAACSPTGSPAPDGASEFINIRLTHLGRGFIVPQVYIYAGEGFSEVDESFFGFMTRDGEQAGQPFEARTVRMKSALYGASRTAVPLVFSRGEDGAWRAKWLHLYLRGHGTAAW